MKNDKASSTALLIAKCLVYASSHPKLAPLLPAESAALSEQFLRASIGWRAHIYKLLARTILGRMLVQCLEAGAVPGIIAHYLLRKRCIARWVDTGVSQGCKQVVILGAGFDPLGYRLSQKNPQLRVFEIDHPATQALKRRAAPPTPAISLIAADLSQDSLEHVLEQNPGFSFERPTIFIAEGLFMYLSLPKVLATLALLERFAGGEASFIFSYMVCDRHGKARFFGQNRFVDRWLQAQSESFVWGRSEDDLRTLLSGHAYHVKDHADGAKLRADAGGSPMSANGENLVYIERAG